MFVFGTNTTNCVCISVYSSSIVSYLVVCVCVFVDVGMGACFCQTCASL